MRLRIIISRNGDARRPLDVIRIVSAVPFNKRCYKTVRRGGGVRLRK